MFARASNVKIFGMLAWCFVVAGTQAATAQALCPVADVRPFGETEVRAFDAGFLRNPKTITVETDLCAFGDTLPGGTEGAAKREYCDWLSEHQRRVAHGRQDSVPFDLPSAYVTLSSY
jgi:hypothetical protein